MIGQVRPGLPALRLPMGPWAGMRILAADGCEYAIAAGDLPANVKPGQVVRFDADGARAVNIKPAGASR